MPDATLSFAGISTLDSSKQYKESDASSIAATMLNTDQALLDEIERNNDNKEAENAIGEANANDEALLIAETGTDDVTMDDQLDGNPPATTV